MNTTNGTIEISAIVWDSTIYPRDKWNTSTIERYADAIKAGAQFPPVVVEQGTNRLLDGKHRTEAHKLYAEMYAKRRENLLEGETWPEPKTAIPVEYHTIPEGVPVKLYAASLSSKHGDRLKGAEAKALAREIYEANPDFKIKTIAEYLGVSMGSAHGYVSDILARRNETQQAVIARLDALGWTQDEIGKAVNITQGRVAQKLLEISELKKLIVSTVRGGIPHTDVAQRYNMPVQLVWAIDLENRTDAERLARLDIKTQPYDVWSFPSCHDLFGADHPGRIPGQLVAHVLYFFTAPGDMVVDPMAGSGTTLDVCLTMGRRCYAFDIDSRHNRPDVIKHDILCDGWHERIKKADLIFWDPPYFSKMDSMTIGSDGYIEGSISKLTRDEYLSFFAQRLAEARGMVKRGTRLAFLMSDWDDNTGEREGIFIWDYASLISDAGWKLRRHIQVPLSTQQVHPDIVNKFRESRRLARLERYLLVAEA